MLLHKGLRSRNFFSPFLLPGVLRADGLVRAMDGLHGIASQARRARHAAAARPVARSYLPSMRSAANAIMINTIVARARVILHKRGVKHTRLAFAHTRHGYHAT